MKHRYIFAGPSTVTCLNQRGFLLWIGFVGGGLLVFVFWVFFWFGLLGCFFSCEIFNEEVEAV